ncbi:MAG: nucleoside triphosphate pyrophosphohydrolase [Bacteroidales bacterium]|nr:nucleoside triphosphate pyrophosphohydrolase [Bacteroidales bacterium]
MNNRSEQLKAFERLLDVMDELRVKCPWDRKQTLESLRPATIEEVYELSDTIINNDLSNLCKEIGDVLLHVVFYAKIGSENGEFDIADVCNKLCDKLVYRHPHVFGDVAAKDAEQVVKNWEQLKRVEKDGNKTVLSGVPASLPPLLKAYRMQDKARAVGFDWEKKEDVWDKVYEEIGEFKEELAKIDGSEKAKKEAEGELGDLLFSIVNASRLYDLNPDTALESTCRKFKERFTYLETQSKADGKDLSSMTIDEMEYYWQEAKKHNLK